MASGCPGPLEPHYEIRYRKTTRKRQKLEEAFKEGWGYGVLFSIIGVIGIIIFINHDGETGNRMREFLINMVNKISASIKDIFLNKGWELCSRLNDLLIQLVHPHSKWSELFFVFLLLPLLFLIAIIAFGFFFAFLFSPLLVGGLAGGLVGTIVGYFKIKGEKDEEITVEDKVRVDNDHSLLVFWLLGTGLTGLLWAAAEINFYFGISTIIAFFALLGIIAFFALLVLIFFTKRSINKVRKK